MTCSVESCDRAPIKKGMCNKHYLRWWKHGDPTAGGTEKGIAQTFYRDVVLNCDSSDCLIWPFAREEHGYAILNKDGRCQIVSRLACEDVNGKPPRPDDQAAHSCGNGHEGCVNPTHLRWATYEENREDMVSHGRSLRGAKNHFAKLTEPDVRKIREMLGVVPQRTIAVQFGITQSAIQSIASGKSWAWME